MTETHDRLIGRFASILADLHDIDQIAVRLCEAGRRMLGADGASLTLATSSGLAVAMAITDELAGQLEDLQDVVSEGPSRDAYLHGEVQTAEFPDQGGGSRWPLMYEHGERLEFTGTIVAIPLRPDGVTVGTLTAHLDSGVEAAVDIAAFLGTTIGTALLQDPTLGIRAEAHTDGWPLRAQIHQATGMIISQVGVRAEDAMALLRGQAFAKNTTLLDVAQQIVERRINFRDFTIEGD